MLCQKCGTKVEEGATFCPNCGTRLNTQNDTKTAEVPKENKKEEKSKKHLPVKGIAVLAVTGVVVLGSVIAFSNRKTTIDMNDIYDVEIGGHNGYGWVEVIFDEDKFSEKYDDKLSLNKKNAKKWVKEQYSDSEEAKDVYESLCDFTDPAEHVSSMLERNNVITASGTEYENGDTVEFEYTNQELLDTIEELYNCKFENLKSCKVKGLEEVKDYDPFSDINITFEGTEPNGTVQIENPEEWADMCLDYEVANNGNFSNGDIAQITVTTPDGTDDYLERVYGVRLSKFEEEVEVKGLPGYVKSASEIPDETMENMKKAVDEYCDKANETSSEKGDVTLKGEYIGNYFVTNNVYIPGWDPYERAIYLCYRMSIIPPDYSDDKVHTYYTWFRFDDLMKDGDGNITMDYSEFSRPDSTYYIEVVNRAGETVNPGYWGYEDFNTMYEECFDSTDDSYDVEENLTDFSEK